MNYLSFINYYAYYYVDYFDAMFSHFFANVSLKKHDNLLLVIAK